MPRLIRVLAGRTDHFVGFVVLWLKFEICGFTIEQWVQKIQMQAVWSGSTLLANICQLRSIMVRQKTEIMSRLMTKLTKWHVHPVKTQISLGIRPVWSESSLCTQWVAKGSRFLHVDSEDSDQTGLMPRLIWVFAGRMPFCWVCHAAAQIMSNAWF